MYMSRNLAVALINCDPSGLNDETLGIYNRIDFDFDVVHWHEESSDINARCDYTGLWDHCVKIEVAE